MPLIDPDGRELRRLREEGRATLEDLTREMNIGDAAAEVVPGDFAARELQRITERPESGLIVVGWTTRGPLGRLLVGGVGERLLSGAACPVAIAPRGYADAPTSRLARIGVGLDASDEARHALDAAVALARHGRCRAPHHHRLPAACVRRGGDLRHLEHFRERRNARDCRAVPRQRARRGSRERSSRGALRRGLGRRCPARGKRGSRPTCRGSRGYGPLGAVLTGSATTALARGAACPVLVTPRGTRFDLLD